MMIIAKRSEPAASFPPSLEVAVLVGVDALLAGAQIPQAEVALQLVSRDRSQSCFQDTTSLDTFRRAIMGSSNLQTRCYSI